MNELQMKIFDQNNLIKFGSSESLAFSSPFLSHLLDESFYAQLRQYCWTTTALVLCKTQITAEYCDFDMNKMQTNKEEEKERERKAKKNTKEKYNRIVQQKFYRFGYQLNDQPHSVISDAEMILNKGILTHTTSHYTITMLLLLRCVWYECVL